MTLLEALELVIVRTGVERYRYLCLEHPNALVRAEYSALVQRLAKEPPGPGPTAAESIAQARAVRDCMFRSTDAGGCGCARCAYSQWGESKHLGMHSMRQELSIVAMKRYGWIRDLPDQRDRKFQLAQNAQAAAGLPPAVDLRAQCPPVYDQGELGSCTANAIAAALEFDAARQKLPVSTPSRLFIYYNERSIEGTVGSDSGAQIRDGIKSVAQWGDCPETEWPYVVSQFTVQPPAACYDDASKHLALVYEAVNQDLSDLRGCLAAGFPFVFGFTVYASFESDYVAERGMCRCRTGLSVRSGAMR